MKHESVHVLLQGVMAADVGIHEHGPDLNFIAKLHHPPGKTFDTDRPMVVWQRETDIEFKGFATWPGY